MCEIPGAAPLTLRSLFKERGLRQDFVAERLGVTEAAISKWVNGRSRLPSMRVQPLADVLHVTSDIVLNAAAQALENAALGI